VLSRRAAAWHRFLHIQASVLIASTALLLSSCASSEAQRQRDYDKHIARTRAALLSAGDPDSLAAAGLLPVKGPDAGRLALLARASAMAPERADLAWVYLVACTPRAECDAEPIAARLRSLDPGNAAAFSAALDRSASAGDALRARAALTAMSERAEFSIYWSSTIVHLARAIERTGKMPTAEALVIVIGELAALSIPAFTNMSLACMGAALQEADVLTACRRLAAGLRRGDTYVLEMIGVAIAKRAWPQDSQEYRDALEARRVARYRMSIEMPAGDTSGWNDPASEHYLELLAAHRTEQEVFLAQLKEAGRDPDPPADWKESPPLPQ
jgi:hypothetical protein